VELLDLRCSEWIKDETEMLSVLSSGPRDCARLPANFIFIAELTDSERRGEKLCSCFHCVPSTTTFKGYKKRLKRRRLNAPCPNRANFFVAWAL
jgi:hypothetical protein